jgi:acetylornithine deacetylase
VEAQAEPAFLFLERLVAEPSTVGEEGRAQAVFADHMATLGLDVEEMPIPADITDDVLAGVLQSPYEGRGNLVARTARGNPAVLLNGHIDVVPAGGDGWTSPPWQPTRRDGWLFGRGAGDMKGGFAMAALAMAALRAVAPSLLEVPMAFLSVIEEECTGNGSLAALRGGVTGETVILPEPTDLGLLVGGVGVVWVDVVVTGGGGHAQAADRVERPVDMVGRLIPALEDLGRRVAKEADDDAFSAVAQPYNVNVGLLAGGDWRSSVASTVRLGVRMGYPRSWTPDEAVARIRSLAGEAADGSGLQVSVEPAGYRAHGYLLESDHPLVDALASVHARLHGERPPTYVLGSTTDARYYLNQAGVPALCYGPVARRIHGVDEAVELQSIVKGAMTLAVYLAATAMDRSERGRADG